VLADTAIHDMIRYYTREAGVRNLEREISKIGRKSVKQLLLNPAEKTVTVDSNNLDKYLACAAFATARPRKAIASVK